MRAANYVEETTTSIAGTNGDGAVTLTQITSIPRFSTVFGTQATTVRYVIEDTVNKKFETGIGSVSSNVLTRTRPQITWDGTTYDDSTPSAIAFGSTPTSGDIKIRMAATAESQGTVIPGQAIGLTNQDSWAEYPLSAHITNWNNAGVSVSFATNTERYQYYKNEAAGLLSGFQCEVTSAGASSSVKAALYSVGADGLPQQRIALFNELDATTTGIKTDTTTSTWSPAGPVWLTPGWYAIGFTVGGNAVGLRCFSNAASAVFGPSPLGRTATYAGNKSLLINGSGSHTNGPPQTPSISGASVGTGQVVWMGLKVTA